MFLICAEILLQNFPRKINLILGCFSDMIIIFFFQKFCLMNILLLKHLSKKQPSKSSHEQFTAATAYLSKNAAVHLGCRADSTESGYTQVWVDQTESLTGNCKLFSAIIS